MIIIDGKLVANELLENLKNKLVACEKKPTLAVIIVGENPASKIYVNLKKKKAIDLGMNSMVIELPETINQEVLLEKIDELNNDDDVNAILVQLPLPEHIDTQTILKKINPKKDVDCFHPYNVGEISVGNKPCVYPCTPKGILKLLDYYNIEIAGKSVVVVGRSNIVGKPVAQMLLNRNATVTICHSKTKNLTEITRKADILVVAIGSAKFIKSDMVKQDVVVIDVGMNKDENGKLCGDVDFENVKEIASYITPVPGGVGPMTICSLMENTFDLYNVNKF